MKFKIFLIIVLVSVILSGCLPTSNSATTTAQKNAELSDHQVQTLIDTLEQSKHFYSFCSKNASDKVVFSELSQDYLIGTCITIPKTGGSLLYGYYSDAQRWSIDEETDGVCNDPKELFDYSYALEADEVDWILKNVFNVEPNRDLVTEGSYYHDDKLYIQGGPFGGYLWPEYLSLVDYKYLGNNK